MVYVAVDGWVEWRLGPMYVQERPFPKGVRLSLRTPTGG